MNEQVDLAIADTVVGSGLKVLSTEGLPDAGEAKMVRKLRKTDTVPKKTRRKCLSYMPVQMFQPVN